MNGVIQVSNSTTVFKTCVCVVRERRRRREQQAQEERWAEELRLQVCARRQKARREFHQRQLELLHLLPPGNTHTHTPTHNLSLFFSFICACVCRSSPEVPGRGGKAGCCDHPKGLARSQREEKIQASQAHTLSVPGDRKSVV